MKKILNKPFCIGMLAIGFIYGLVLPFCWGNNPLDEHGTLSLLCEDRQLFFWLWGIVTIGGVIINAQYMYKKFEYKNRFFDALCLLSFISMCVVALTLGHSIEDWNPKRIAHWVATGVFIVFCVASIVLFFMVNMKKRKGFRLLTGLSWLIPLTFGLIFGLYGKSGLMEIVPVAMMQILLFVVNFTDLIKTDKIEEAQTAAVTN